MDKSHKLMRIYKIFLDLELIRNQVFSDQRVNKILDFQLALVEM